MSFLGTYRVSGSLVGRFAGEGTKAGSPPFNSQCSSRVEFDSTADAWLNEEEMWTKALESSGDLDSVDSAVVDNSAELHEVEAGGDSVKNDGE